MTLKLAEKGDDLSPREWQVLTLVTQGLENKQIARRLGISPRTVEIQRANAIVKLGAGTSLHASILALVHGITSLDAEVTPEQRPAIPRIGPKVVSAMADVDAWLARGGKLGLPEPDESCGDGVTRLRNSLLTLAKRKASY